MAAARTIGQISSLVSHQAHSSPASSGSRLAFVRLGISSQGGNSLLTQHPALSRGSQKVAAKGTNGGGNASVNAAASSASEAVSRSVEVVETEETNSRVRLTVTVPVNICKDTWTRETRRLVKDSGVIQSKGYKKGARVPDIALYTHLGKKRVKTMLLEALLKDTLPAALQKVEKRALKESEHIVSKYEDMVEAYSPDKPFQYEVTVDMAPEVKWLGSDRPYVGMDLTVEIPNTTPEDEAEAELASRLKDLGSLRVSEETGIRMGDVAIIDLSATQIDAEGNLGELIPSAQQKGFQVDTEEAVKSLLPGFVEGILGMAREETREFNLTFPPTWQQENLRGTQARFTITCKEVFVRVLPELEDSLAPKLLEGARTIKEVRDSLILKHEQIQERMIRQNLNMAVTEGLSKVCHVDVPNSLLEEQGRQMYAAKLIEIQVGRRLSPEQVSALASEEMVNNYLLAKKSEIQKQVTQALAVAEIYKAEQLSFTEEEAAAETASAVEEFKRYNQEYDEKKVREQAEELLEGSKVLEWLLESAKITYSTSDS